MRPGSVQTSVGVFIWKRNGDISSDTIIRGGVGRLGERSAMPRPGVEDRAEIRRQTTAQSGIR